MGGLNQPFDFPRSKPRGLLRVDTERRSSPRPKGWGLAPSKYQGSFLHKPRTQNTQQFIRKYKFHPIYFSESFEYCYNVNICLKEILEGVVEAEWLMRTRRKTPD
jgi:hypothetical protein